MFFMF